MKKVKVSQEQAEAIEDIKESIILDFKNRKDGNYPFPVKWEVLLELSIEEVEEALFEGYTEKPRYSPGDNVIVNFSDVGKELCKVVEQETSSVVYVQATGLSYPITVPTEIVRFATPEEIEVDQVTDKMLDKVIHTLSNSQQFRLREKLDLSLEEYKEWLK